MAKATQRSLSLTRADEDEAGIRFLADIMLRYETRDWGLTPEQRDLARQSPVFKELMRQFHLHPGPDDAQSLTALWEAAGRPADKGPATADEYEGGLIEDRGAAGWWADYESTVWYAAALCDLVTPGVVVCMFY